MYILTDTVFILNIYSDAHLPTCSVAQWLVDWTTEWAVEVRIPYHAIFFLQFIDPFYKVTCKCEWIFTKMIFTYIFILSNAQEHDAHGKSRS